MFTLSGLMSIVQILVSVLLFSQTLLPQIAPSAPVDFDNNVTQNAAGTGSFNSASANLSGCSDELLEEAGLSQFLPENSSLVPDIDVNPVSVNFGTVEVGSTSAPATINIANVGGARL